MKTFVFLATDGDGKIDTKASFLTNDRDEALTAFGKAKDGLATVFDLSLARPMKRSNFITEHRTNKDNLYDLTDAKLRSEAKKRKLEVGENPLASRGDIIHAIQQHDLLQGSKERDQLVTKQNRELAKAQQSVTNESAPIESGPTGEAKPDVSAYEELTVPELRDLADKNNVEVASKATKAEIIEALQKANVGVPNK